MLAAAVTDSATMLRRNLKHMRRYPSMTLMLIGQPIVFLLLFVYVFGATMGAGLTGPGGGRTEYLAYITPAILLMTVASVALSTAISVATDMTEGIVARFRTMAIARVSLLRPDLAHRRPRAGQQEPRDRQQPAHVPRPAALPRQRLRPH